MKPFVWICLAVLTPAANAVDALMPWIEVMRQADTDTDGRVSTNEVSAYSHTDEHVGFQAFMADHFIELDTDNDGSVSVDEFKAGIVRLGMTDEEVSRGFSEGFAFMSKEH